LAFTLFLLSRSEKLVAGIGKDTQTLVDHVMLGHYLFVYGPVEKSRQRRSRHFSVLTYSQYAPRAKMAVALLDGPF